MLRRATVVQKGGKIQNNTKTGNRFKEEKIKELKVAFELFDSDDNGRISGLELKAAMRALGYEVTRKDVVKILDEMGKPSDSSITWEEFCDIMSGNSNRFADFTGEIRRIFDLLDIEKCGKVEYSHLRQLAAEVGHFYTENQLHAMIEEAGKGRGYITFEDFLRIMKLSGDEPLSDFGSDEDT